MDLTNYIKAFALNAIIAISSTLAIELRRYLDKNLFDRTEKEKMIITFIGVVMACFMAYYFLHILFGFGGGMLIQNSL